MFKEVTKFDISAYKLVMMSEKFKQMRRPHIITKQPIANNRSYFVWSMTYYNDEKLIGTRLISHYFLITRSIVFA